MSATTAAFSEFVDNVERTVLDPLVDRKPNMVRSLFTEVPWSQGDSEKVTFNSIALSGFAQRVDENETIPVVNAKKGNELSKTQIQYSEAIAMSYRMLKFNTRYEQSRQAFMARQVLERVAGALDLEMTIQAFSGASATTFTPKGKAAYNIATSDGQALASATHSYGGKTFSNILNGGGALSIANLNTLIEQGQNGTPDDFGTYITPNYDTVVIAESQPMIVKCHQMFGSALTPETGNNAVNYYGGPGQMKVIALKHGNKTPLGAIVSGNAQYRWALMDSQMIGQSFQFMQAETPTVHGQFINQDNLVGKAVVTSFAAYAAVQPQGTLYSLSTTAPTIS